MADSSKVSDTGDRDGDVDISVGNSAMEASHTEAKSASQASSSPPRGEKRKPEYKYEEIKRQKRLAANRRSAAASRQRRLDLIEELKRSVSDLTKTVATLTRENKELRRQLQLQSASMVMGTQQLGVNPGVVSDPVTASAGVQGIGFPGIVASSLSQDQQHLFTTHPSSLGGQQFAQGRAPQEDAAANLQHQLANSGGSTAIGYPDLHREISRQQQQLAAVMQTLQQTGGAQAQASPQVSNSANTGNTGSAGDGSV